MLLTDDNDHRALLVSKDMRQEAILVELNLLESQTLQQARDR
jgi:hypothetical protein